MRFHALYRARREINTASPVRGRKNRGDPQPALWARLRDPLLAHGHRLPAKRGRHSLKSSVKLIELLEHGGVQAEVTIPLEIIPNTRELPNSRGRPSINGARPRFRNYDAVFDCDGSHDVDYIRTLANMQN